MLVYIRTVCPKVELCNGDGSYKLSEGFSYNYSFLANIRINNINCNVVAYFCVGCFFLVGGSEKKFGNHCIGTNKAVMFIIHFCHHICIT